MRHGTAQGKAPFPGSSSFMLLWETWIYPHLHHRVFLYCQANFCRLNILKMVSNFCVLILGTQDVCKCSKKSSHTYLKVGNQNYEVKFSSCFFKTGLSGTTSSHKNTLKMQGFVLAMCSVTVVINCEACMNYINRILIVYCLRYKNADKASTPHRQARLHEQIYFALHYLLSDSFKYIFM